MTPAQPAGWKPVPEAIERQKAERSDKSEATAIEILKLAVEATKGTNPSSDALASYAETLWKWTTTDTWPAPR
jgi:hypothetical protein